PNSRRYSACLKNCLFVRSGPILIHVYAAVVGELITNYNPRAAVFNTPIGAITLVPEKQAYTQSQQENGNRSPTWSCILAFQFREWNRHNPHQHRKRKGRKRSKRACGIGSYFCRRCEYKYADNPDDPGSG